jgi:hypothetical protein
MDDISFPQNQLRILAKHFFGRFFDSELLAAPHSNMHLLMVQMSALLVLPGLFKTFFSISKYSYYAWFPVAVRDNAVLADAHFYLCLSMILTGIITIFEWEALFPDPKDFLILTPLPIVPRKLFLAKILALSLFVVLFNIAINGISSLIFPLSVYVRSNKPGTAGMDIPTWQGVRHLFGHAVSLFLSSVFVFAALVSIRSAISLFFPQKLVRNVSRGAQLLLILALMCALLVFSGVRVDRLVDAKDLSIGFFPQLWFLGIYELMIGHSSQSPVYGSFAGMAWIALAFSLFISAISYTVAYHLLRQKGGQAGGEASYAHSWSRRICAWISGKTYLKESSERGAFSFISATLIRSQGHLLYCGSFIAVGLAICFLCGLLIKIGYLPRAQQMNALLALPLVLSFFLLLGIRMAFSIPADLNANWIFKSMTEQHLKRAHRGAYKFLLCAAVVPPAVFAPLYFSILPLGLVYLHFVYVTILSVLLVEMLMINFNKMPFTCSYVPGKANIKLWWPAFVLACILFSYGTTVLELWMLQHSIAYTTFAVAAWSMAVGMNRYRHSVLRKQKIIFEQDSDESMNILSIELAAHDVTIQASKQW